MLGTLLFLCGVVACAALEPTNRSTNQPTDASIINESIMQPGTYFMDCLSEQSHPCVRSLHDDFIDQSTVQSIKRLPNQSRRIINQMINKTNSQQSDKSTKQPVGPVTILDLSSGATTYQNKFANIYTVMQSINQTFNHSAVLDYCRLIHSIKQTIYQTINPSTAHSNDVLETSDPVDQSVNQSNNQPIILYLTSPSFFSHITNRKPLSQNDEYYHSHIDALQYGSFDYTALIYLSDYDVNFQGGEFVFLSNEQSNDQSVTKSKDNVTSVEVEIDSVGVEPSVLNASNNQTIKQSINQIVYPKQGRMMWFSSGAENPHLIKRIKSGSRQALTVAFTMNKDQSIEQKLIDRFPFCDGVIS